MALHNGPVFMHHVRLSWLGRSLFVAACAASISGCGGKTVLGGAPGTAVVPGAELPPPDNLVLSQGVPQYTVGPYDRLTIEVQHIPELAAREVVVDANNNVSFPLVGAVNATGMTPGQLADTIAMRLRREHVRNPEVTVNLKEMVSQTVTVGGEVRMPGIYPVMGKLSLMRAVARAQGMTPTSDQEDVVVFRNANGQRYAALYNLAAIRRGAYGDPDIYANDVITVGDSKARRLFQDLVTLVPAVASPLIIALGKI